MDDKKMLEAIANVIRQKLYLVDSLSTTETPPGFRSDDGLWMRTVSITFTEILQKQDLDRANNNNGRFERVYEQIVNEYNRLTAYDFERKDTEDGVEVKTTWLE